MVTFRGLAVLLAALGLAVVLATPSEAQLFGRKKDDSTVRVNELEERLRVLTGQIEQLSFQMRELQDQMRRMQEDNEYRFQQLEGGTPGKRSDIGQPSQTNGAQEFSGAPKSLGTLPASGSGDADWSATGGYENGATNLPTNGPIDLSALAGGAADVPSGPTGLDAPQDPLTTQSAQTFAGLSASGDPREDYDRAYSYAVNGQYAAAEEGFRSFIETYPDDRLASNAQFWLGESLLAQRNYRDAADAFLKTYTDNPGSDKSPDSLLKLGLSLNGLGEGDAACATFAELLNKFPNAAPAVLSQAREERSRAQCS
ncbi:tol-pal system protein YbgF [Roseibium polysiphoniae]|uniref:Cell division coordinator CpoB n=1 Tax=Roseibium polysiphoniae TaxID=2571221 RepID=A0ABR9CCR6_9HYPH|nr:tol-pal system protein YbgF [Roseibium polysiphoniae]MBD8876875.1 tol-pal system protein YbgF [Roseibium polysiphoniae]